MASNAIAVAVIERDVIRHTSIIFCIDILYSKTPLFEEIYDQIKDKFIREREDILVKEYIENLRNFYEIEKYSF